MKGVVFTGFFDMVEERFGFDEVDALVADCNLSTDGAYSDVGTYDSRTWLRSPRVSRSVPGRPCRNSSNRSAST